MDAEYIKNVIGKNVQKKSSNGNIKGMYNSGGITADYINDVINRRSRADKSFAPSVIQTSVEAPDLEIPSQDKGKIQSQNKIGNRFLGQQELEDRGKKINIANSAISGINLLSGLNNLGNALSYYNNIQRQVTEEMDRTGQDGTAVRDRLTYEAMDKVPFSPADNSIFDGWRQQQENVLAEAKDLSKYSNEELVHAYEGIDNYNVFERNLDFSTKNDALYTMKQQLDPYYNASVRQNAIDKLTETGLYNDFLLAYIPTNQTDIQNRLAIGREVFLDDEKKAAREALSEATGLSQDELMNLGNYILKEGIVLPTMHDLADNHPVAASALSLGTNFMGNMQGSAYGIYSNITGAPVTSDSSGFNYQDITGEIRGTVNDKIDNPIGQFAYNTGMSIGDSLLAQVAGGGKVGTLLMGMGAYSSTLQDGAEKGLTPSQMQATALAAGAAEYAFEKISWDRIDLIARGHASPNILANIAAQMATEGAEEGLTEVTNIIVDDLVNGGASEMAQLKEFYISQGMNEEEAEQKVFVEFAKQVGLSIAGGAVSGGVTGGGASVYNRITGNNHNNIIEQSKQNEIPVLQSEPEVNPYEQFTTQMREVGLNADGTFLQPYGESLNVNVENTAPTAETKEIDLTKATESDAQAPVSEVLSPSVETVNKTAEQGGLSSLSDGSISDSVENNNDGFVPTTYQNGNGIDAYDEHTSANLTSSKGVTSNNVEFSQFVEDALDESHDGSSTVNYYFGTVSEELADDIFVKTGLDMEGFNIIASNDNIRHAKNDHSDAVKEAKLNQVPLTAELISKLPQVYNNPDNITVSDHQDSRGRKVIKFEKRINGIAVVVDAISNGRNRLALDTMYIKNSHPTEVDAKTPQPLRPKQSVGKATFDSSIPNFTENVNKTTGRTMAEDTGIGNNAIETVAELDGQVRGYNESIVNKSDLPTEIKNEFINNPQFYEVLSNKTTLEKANAILENSDTRSAIAKFNRLVDQKDPVAVPLGYNLAKQLQQVGYFAEAVEVLRKMSEKLTEAGQFTQAAAITLMHGDPTTALQYLTREIDNLNIKGREKYGKKWTDFELTESEQQELSSLDVGDEQGIKNVYEKVYTRIRQQYPSTMREKLTEFRRVSMLLNMRTNVRNVVSNALLMPVRWTSDRLSALGQGFIHLIKPEYQSTQALYVSRNSKELAKEAWNTVKDTLLEDGKYEDVSGAVRDKQVFKGSKIAQELDTITNGALTKANVFLGKKAEPSLLETARNFTYWLLKKGDDGFVRMNFESRMASYLAAQKITDLSSIPPEAYTLATQEALKATFKDDNALTKMFSAVKKNTGLFGEVILPFTKTPANLAMRGYDYSIGGYIELFRTLSNSKSRTWSDVTRTMDSVSQSVVGTGAIALGFALAAAGFITGPLSDDDDEAAFQRSQGMLPYSIHIGGNYYTYDWAQPAAIPLILGATIYNATQESDNVMNGIYQGSLAAVDSWFSLSPLQNVQEIFGGYGTPAENIADTLLETPLSFIPAQLGALARTADTTQRVTYSNGHPLETLANSAISKIPFLSQSLPAAYDTWGNEIHRSDTTGEAAFAQLLNPGQLGNSNITPIDDEITRLYDSTGNSSVFPPKVDWSYTIDGESVKLDNEQYSEMQKITGQTSYEAAEHFINSGYYDNLSDDVRADILGDIYSFAQANAKHEMFGYDIANNDTYKKKYAVYQSIGVTGLVDYMGYKEMADTDGSGTLTHEEIKGFLSAQPNLTQSEKADWFDIYFPKANENPFREEESTSSSITVDYINSVINNRNK